MLATLSNALFPPRAERTEVLLNRAERSAAKMTRLAEAARQWRQENARLRRLTSMNEPERIVHRAHEAALKLATMHLAGMLTSRRAALAYGGISERSYFYGRALLELAAVYGDNQFLTDDAEQIENNLQAAVRAAVADFHLLKRRLPPSRRPRSL